MSMTVFDDLAAEQEHLDEVLSGLPEPALRTASGAAGWTIADVVLHLAQTEEAVVAAATGGVELASWRRWAGTVDEAMDAMVRAERGPPAQICARWRAARTAAVRALRQADPNRPLPWVATPLKPATLATTRLAEHWAHSLDITAPLGIPYPDPARLRHVAWLAHRSLRYAFALAGEPPHPVRCELTAPDGTTWQYGPADADSSITGPAGAFCRVAAQRLAPEESGLVAQGRYGPAALRVLRTYAR